MFGIEPFKMDDKTYRFDFYRTSHAEIIIDHEADYLPEFDIDFGDKEGEEGIKTEIIHDEILYKDENSKTGVKIANSFPGFKLHMKMNRDPIPVFTQYLIPAFLVFLLLNFTYYIEMND